MLAVYVDRCMNLLATVNFTLVLNYEIFLNVSVILNETLYTASYVLLCTAAIFMQFRGNQLHTCTLIHQAWLTNRRAQMPDFFCDPVVIFSFPPTRIYHTPK